MDSTVLHPHAHSNKTTHLRHSQPLSAHASQRTRTLQPGRTYRGGSLHARTLLAAGGNRPASIPCQTSQSCCHPQSQIFKYMCWNYMTIMALAKI